MLVAKQQGMDIIVLPSNSSRVVTCAISAPLPVWSAAQYGWLLWVTPCPGYHEVQETRVNQAG